MSQRYQFHVSLEGKPVPDHATIARFISLHFSKCSKNTLAEVSDILLEIGEISGKSVFIDGTKLESVANKYTFVWKRSVTKNCQKLFEKISDLIRECEVLYGIQIVYHDQISLHTLKRMRKKLYRIKKQEDISFVHGKGKRKTPLQRSIETLESYIQKLKEYIKKIHLCGTRNSYSKTDPDATFMRMKEDAMMNGQLKPAYNLQHGVDSEYITWLTIGPQPTDTTTLIPFLNDAQEHLKFKYKNITADAGYESEENYLFLEANGQLSYIKPANYEISKTRKYKNDIGKIENMEYDVKKDIYTCRNGKKLGVEHIRHSKSRTGYVSEKTIYKCEDCNGCPYKSECIKGNNCKTPLEERTKTLQVAKTFLKHRKEDLDRILSEEGILFRTNRSIQAEGSFGDLKQDMQFRRYLSKGNANVLAESTFLAMARNINKLHNKIQNGRTGTHLFPIKSA